MTEPVRTRIAPAPSGSLHVGNARTALYNWLFARGRRGTFILRIEDTDAARTSEEAIAGVLADLRWLGLDWDEGPDTGGDFGPYRQSERIGRYDAVLRDLAERGAAYRCYCTQEELDDRRRRAQAEGRVPGYDGRCRRLTDAERSAFEAAGRPHAMRFAVPPGRNVDFVDMVRGRISTGTEQIRDFVLRRSDGSPTYLLAAGVDDALMNVTHVIRGEDLIPATPRQLLLREAMGISDEPRFAHLPLIVDDRGRPLSKRWGDVSVGSYRDRGFLAEAMINYLALLGWAYDDRTNVFSLDELVEKFKLERVGRNPATFDVAKLEWLNALYIRSLAPETLAASLMEFCRRAGLSVDDEDGQEKLRAVAPLLVDRLRRLDEAPGMIRFLFERSDPDESARRALKGQGEYLLAARSVLAGLEKWTSSEIEAALRALAEERALKPKAAFQPIRAAVTGTLVSPPLFESLEILGRAPTLDRLELATTEGGDD